MFNGEDPRERNKSLSVCLWLTRLALVQLRFGFLINLTSVPRLAFPVMVTLQRMCKTLSQISCFPTFLFPIFLLLAGTMVFITSFSLCWTLCFILHLHAFVEGHLYVRNDDATELPLPSLSSSLRPQATGYNFDLEAALPPASNTVSPLSVLPTNCAAYVGGEECPSSSGMTAMAVTYEDCGDAFTICRCADANMAIDTVVDRLGRVPVGLRRFIATVFVLRDDETEAYTNLTTGDIHFFGDCAMDTWIHEVSRTHCLQFTGMLTSKQATHTFDFASLDSVPSNSTAWQQAIAADTCVPDPYSRSNRVEVS